MKHQHGLFNMYLTTTISVALVLCLVGLECDLLLSARELVRHVKENVVMTIVLCEETANEEIEDLDCLLESSSYCLNHRFISKEEALQDHIQHLGEDPQKFLGYNPLTDAFEVHLRETYAQSDSIANIVHDLKTFNFVDKVIYQEDVVKVLDNNLNEASLILLGIALALLIIALVLIANTIQLQVYSKRFLINTMRLVGATPWVIRWPFIRRNMTMGVEAGIIAIVVLTGVYYYCKLRLGIMLYPPTWQNYCFVGGVVLLSGLLITFLASLVATNMYIRMKIDKMYEI